MEVWFTVVMVLAFAWLAYETKFLTVRLPHGSPVKQKARIESAPMVSDADLRKVRNTTYQCPCGFSTKHAASFFPHQDRCWAWAYHPEALTMRRNDQGGFKAEGARFILPKYSKRRMPSFKVSLLKPHYPSYSGDWVQHTEPMCGKQWLKAHQNHEGIGNTEMVVICDGKQLGQFATCDSKAMASLIKVKRAERG